MSYPHNKNDTQILQEIVDGWRDKGVPELTIKSWLAENMYKQKELAKPKNRLKRFWNKLQSIANGCAINRRS